MRHKDKTAVRRYPERGRYDFETIAAILDERLVCHVAFTVENQVYVIPMAYARLDDRVILHGSRKSRLVRALASGGPVWITVTLLDALVLARCGFRHSMNYSSVVVFGVARRITKSAERRQAFERLVDHLVPGRWKDARPPDPREDRATELLEVPLEEASAKIGIGPPLDADDDLQLPVWAGVLPLRLSPGSPKPAPDLAPPPACAGLRRAIRSTEHPAAAARDFPSLTRTQAMTNTQPVEVPTP